MKPAIQLHPDMGPQVLKHLRQFGDLPNRGIVAGQAVASAIEDLFGRGGGVYNDVDIFRRVNMRQEVLQAKASHTAARSVLQLRRARDYEGLALMVETINTYSIQSVSRRGELNFVNCIMAAGRWAEALTPERVLSGFDLNCVRVAVDLSTERLHWDRDYERFLATRQLDISMMHTPWHTLQRLVKKSQELPDVYCNIDEAAQACIGVSRSSFIERMTQNHDVSLLFGQKHFELAEAQRSIWEPYFDLKPHILRNPLAARRKPDAPEKVTLWSMQPRAELDKDLQQLLDAQGKAVLFHGQRAVHEHRRAKRDRAYVKLDALVAHRKAVAVDAKLDYVLKHALMQGTAYVAGQALLSVADRVEAFFNKHSGFAGLMLGMSLAQQWDAIARVREVAHRFGRQHLDGDLERSYGVLENLASTADLFEESRMWQLLERDHTENVKPFNVTPLALPRLPAAFAHFRVRELLTPLELDREGRDMGHCVGGYSHAVRRNSSRILSIRNSLKGREGWSTAELRCESGQDIRPDKLLRCAQHRRVANKDADVENAACLEFILGYLNHLAVEGPDADWGALLGQAQGRLCAEQAQVRSTAAMVAKLEAALKLYKQSLRNAQDRQRTLMKRAELLELMSEEPLKLDELKAA